MPRSGVTTLRVIQEAEAVADEVGLANVTLMSVAQRLGVRTPSLYKHIDGMDALQRQLSIRALNELGDVLARACVGKAGVQAVKAISVALRNWAKQHPGRYAATVAAADPKDKEYAAASFAVVQVALDVLASFDLTGDDAIDAARALRSTLHGFIALEQAGGFGLPVDIDRSFNRLVLGLANTLSEWAQPAS
ncbi:MAG TPA: WHG domain-containing protein [Acidothermaceae bacterium]|nr:WHG domain-containing protein [Acidothermaceae bacterium]